MLPQLSLVVDLIIVLCKLTPSPLACCRLLGSTDISLQEVVSKGKYNVNTTLKGKKGEQLPVSAPQAHTHCAGCAYPLASVLCPGTWLGQLVGH